GWRHHRHRRREPAPRGRRGGHSGALEGLVRSGAELPQGSAGAVRAAGRVGVGRGDPQAVIHLIGVPQQGGAALILIGMLRRSVLAFCVVLMTGCGPRTVATSSTRDYVPWLPLHTTGVYPQAPTPSPLAPVPIPAGTQPCKASQLEAASMDGGGATGHMNTPVGVRDRSSVACYLVGYPDITIVDSAGRTLAQAAGVHDRGTFFDSWPPVQVLMQPGTATLASEAHEPMSR